MASQLLNRADALILTPLININALGRTKMISTETLRMNWMNMKTFHVDPPTYQYT